MEYSSISRSLARGTSRYALTTSEADVGLKVPGVALVDTISADLAVSAGVEPNNLGNARYPRTTMAPSPKICLEFTGIPPFSQAIP